MAVAHQKIAISRALRWVIVAVVVVVFCLVFPPFRVVSLEGEGAGALGTSSPDVFDAATFVDDFWSQTLEPKLEEATDLGELLGMVTADPLSARERFARQGLNYYFASGLGTVVELKGRRAILEVGESTISLLIAPPVFGNTLRDGTGLLNVNDFSGLEAFNAVSAVLNDKVEKEVMSSLGDLISVGDVLQFVGCSKAPEFVGNGAVLEFIPLRVEVVR